MDDFVIKVTLPKIDGIDIKTVTETINYYVCDWTSYYVDLKKHKEYCDNVKVEELKE